MIKKIRQRINSYLELLILGYKKTNAIKNTVEDGFSLQLLLNMFDKKTFLSMTSWSISPKEVLHICNDIVINKRKNIIEFGSGFSTICIAQVIKRENLNVNFYSVESNQDWINILSRKLEELDLIDSVKFIYAPICEAKSILLMKNQKMWYDEIEISKAINNTKFDCVIVDGPPSMLSPYIRFSSIPFLKDRLSNKFSIFLDDYRRPIEREILSEWAKILNFESYDFDRYAYLTDNQVYETEPLTKHLF